MRTRKQINVIEQAVFVIDPLPAEIDFSQRCALYQASYAMRPIIRQAREDKYSTASDNTPLIGFEQGYLCEHELTDDVPSMVGGWSLGGGWMDLKVGVSGSIVRLYPTIPLPDGRLCRTDSFLWSSHNCQRETRITCELLQIETRIPHLLVSIKSGEDGFLSTQLKVLRLDHR